MATSPVLFLLLYNALILLGAFRQRRGSETGPALLAILFFCSGMPALIYQIVWQRALFAVYGVNSESVAVVVSAFMIGLGFGSLLGGWLSAKVPQRAILFFAVAEFGTAIFGLASLGIFHWVALRTAGAPLASLVPLSLALLFVPTACMGATLPLLADYLVRTFCPVGYSVGVLYFSNTFGSAVACYLCATFLLRDFGQQGSVQIAAALNLLVGVSAFLFLLRRDRPSTAAALPHEPPPQPGVPFLSLKMAMLLSAFTGCISLGFEIVWFRVFVLASNDRAPAFALLLSTFLAGVAAGAYVAGKLSEKRTPAESALAIAVVLIAAGSLSPWLPPIVAFLKFKSISYLFAVSGFFLIAALLGAVFPLLCRLAIPPGALAGRGVSLIYVANIVGSATGSLLIGFVLFNYVGLRAISSLLAISALLLGMAILVFARRQILPFKLATVVLAVGFASIFLFAQLFYARFYERLTFGAAVPESGRLAHLVENRNGIITVLDNGAIFGSGVYDGFFNIDPVQDKNLVVRAYAVSAFHPAPVRILMVGLSSGSWGQILANHPQVQALDIVEINPGYLKLIPQYPVVSSLLRHPKTHIYIDDGRRWLLSHPHRRYDLIVQNTSFYWRDHSAELLSADYLRIIRSHLSPGGIYYYNTTGSNDVVATGLSVFPHGLRVLNFLAVSDSPISLDRDRWLATLRRYAIDGRPVFDVSNSDSEAVLQKYALLADSIGKPPSDNGLEDSASMRQRIKNPLIITDDNMGWEWREVN
jgi:spermidine synthase